MAEKLATSDGAFMGGNIPITDSDCYVAKWLVSERGKADKFVRSCEAKREVICSEIHQIGADNPGGRGIFANSLPCKKTTPLHVENSFQPVQCGAYGARARIKNIAVSSPPSVATLTK